MLTKEYWDKRYQNGNTQWDIGAVSTPLKTYFDQLESSEIKILIPGAGNAFEIEYLFKKGFQNIYLLDFSQTAIKNFEKRLPQFPKKQLHLKDFFELEDTFDLIIEQTFFCALYPSLRERYVDKMASLLRPNGKLVGLLFNFPLTENGPPFGGSKTEYQNLFAKHFEIEILEEAYNSIAPRKGNELFFKFVRK